MLTNVSLGVFLSPDRTPYVDFDLLKEKGVKFIVAQFGEAKTGDIYIDSEPTLVDFKDWFANVVNEAYRIDVPLFALWQFHPEHWEFETNCTHDQSYMINKLLANKTYHGIFLGNVWRDANTNDPIDPSWLSKRKLALINKLQADHPNVWVGTYNGDAYRTYSMDMESWIGRSEPYSNNRLFWAEWYTTPITTTWEELNKFYPTDAPKKLPPDPDRSRITGISTEAKWYLLNWSINIKLPGIYLDKNRINLGQAHLIFFNGLEDELHKFAFYVPHNQSGEPTDPSEPPNEEPDSNEIVNQLKLINEKLELLIHREYIIK